MVEFSLPCGQSDLVFAMLQCVWICGAWGLFTDGFIHVNFGLQHLNRYLNICRAYTVRGAPPCVALRQTRLALAELMGKHFKYHSVKFSTEGEMVKYWIRIVFDWGPKKECFSSISMFDSERFLAPEPKSFLNTNSSKDFSGLCTDQH